MAPHERISEAFLRHVWTARQSRHRVETRPIDSKGDRMVLATAKVDDVDRFLQTFTTKGAEKRREHGSKGSQVFRDPNDDTRVWAVIDIDEDGYQALLSDPDMPAIFQEAGMQGRPQAAEHVREVDA